MASGRPISAVSRGMQQLFGPGPVSGLADWQLLHRFHTLGDEAAFEALISRHGPMVLGVCRRHLRDPADVDDAFQATFLVLVRKAGILGERDSLGGWLRGVAIRVARRARSDAARRCYRESPGVALDLVVSSTSGPDPESAAIVRDEVRNLPDAYRSAVTLCDLDGLTHEQASRELRWPLGTVKGRLFRARERLKHRLIRRGLAPSAALIGTALTQDAVATVPPLLKAITLAAARSLSSRELSTLTISSHSASLMRATLRTLAMSKLQATAAATFLALGLLGGGGALLARQAATTDPGGLPGRPRAGLPDSGGSVVAAGSHPEASQPAAADAPRPAPGPAPVPDPKTANPIARDQLAEARAIYKQSGDPDGWQTDADVERVDRWSRRIAQAQIDAGHDTPAARAAAVADHLRRMRDLIIIAKKADAKIGSTHMTLVANFVLGEAEAWQEREHRSQTTSGSGPVAAQATSTASRPGPTDARSRAILAKLDQPIAIPFEKPTPLVEIIKYVKHATADDSLPDGIPVYVDEVSLQEHDRTMDSPIRLNLEGVNLGRSLGLMVGQLDLAYAIQEGLMVIATPDRMDQLKSAGMPPVKTPLMIEIERAERGDMTLAELKEFVEKMKLQREAEKLIAGGSAPIERNDGAPKAAR